MWRRSLIYIVWFYGSWGVPLVWLNFDGFIVCSFCSSFKDGFPTNPLGWLLGWSIRLSFWLIHHPVFHPFVFRPKITMTCWHCEATIVSRHLEWTRRKINSRSGYPKKTVTHVKIWTYVIFKYHKHLKLCLFKPNFTWFLKITFKWN
jgi:hypothetical protein